MNYYVKAHDLYKIFGLDWEYCGQQKSEMNHLRWLDRKIGMDMVYEVCRWVEGNRKEWHRFGLIRSHLAEIMAIIQNYPVDFELQEGYKYHNLQEKGEAYKRWKKSKNSTA